MLDLEPRLLPSIAAPPDEFICRLYTEALGRAPDQLGFEAAETQDISTIAHTIYGSAEYAHFGYDASAEVLTLYRGLLYR